jgi:hypothetical protein
MIWLITYDVCIRSTASQCKICDTCYMNSYVQTALHIYVHVLSVFVTAQSRPSNYIRNTRYMVHTVSPTRLMYVLQENIICCHMIVEIVVVMTQIYVRIS